MKNYSLLHGGGGVWKAVIDNFLVEVEGALSRLDDNDTPTWKTELAGLKNRAGDLAKKIYQNCQPDQDGFTEAVFNELKKLVKLLEEAHGTKTANTKSELEKFIADSKNNSDQSKALEIAKKVKNQDSDGEDCVATALKKLKGPSDNKLDQARQKLKNLLAGLKTGNQDAYQVVVVDIENSETDLDKAVQIWQKLQEIDQATSDDDGKLLNALNTLRNDTSNKKAWEALNKYKRDGQSQGYPEEMLKKLNDWAHQRKKNYQEIKNAKTKKDFQAAKVEFMKKPEYKSNQQDYDQIYFPLAEKAAEIREKRTSASSAEKELAELIVLTLLEYNDWKNQLTDLESKFKQLKEFVPGGKKHNVVEKFSSLQQQALEKLVNKMETKLQEWRAEKTKSENNNNSPQVSWYKTPLGIVGIICGVAVMAAGIIYYLVKQNAGGEEDNQI